MNNYRMLCCYVKKHRDMCMLCTCHATYIRAALLHICCTLRALLQKNLIKTSTPDFQLPYHQLWIFKYSHTFLTNTK